MDSLVEGAFWSGSKTDSGSWLSTEYREWQFNPIRRRFVARHSGEAPPKYFYPELTYTELCDLFQRHERAVPRWVDHLAKEQYWRRLQEMLRPSVLETSEAKVSFWMEDDYEKLKLN